MVSEQDQLARALQAILSRVWGERAEVSGLDPVTTGASRETWIFRVKSGEGRATKLVLRRDPPGLVRPAMMEREAAALRAAREKEVPVPAVIASGDGDNEMGVPYIIMEYVPGEVVPRRILENNSLKGAHETIVRQCGTILARIHAMETDAVPDVPYDNLGRLRSELKEYGSAHPVFELAFRWLKRHRPRSARRTIVHGDFRNGNLIVGPDGIRAVLDWEVVHRGDPMEDLGWLCMRAWRYGADQPVGGFGPRSELYAAYKRESGVTVDPEVVRWWEIVATLKWGINCLELSHRHLSGAVPSLELATIGRRVSETEFDLLDLISQSAAVGAVPNHA